MMIAVSKNGINVNYKCFKIKKYFWEKCKDQNTDKCFTCKYCKAEMSAIDATRLLNRKD